MAPPGIDEEFRKIKIDTAVKHRISSSPFSTIEKNYGLAAAGGSTPAADAAAAATDYGKDKVGSLDSQHLSESFRPFGHANTSRRTLNWQLGDEGIEEADYGEDSLLSTSEMRSTPFIERERLDTPLLEQSSSSFAIDGVGVLNDGKGGHNDRSFSESDKGRFDPVTGHPFESAPQPIQANIRPGEPRYPLQQATVDEFATFSPLTTGTSASSVPQGARTPLTPTVDYGASSVAVVSPPAATPWPTRSSSRQRDPLRSVSSFRSMHSSTGSLRRTRRSSARESSATSPAATYLSAWNRQNTTQERSPEPDDEGQEIGDQSGYIIGRQIGIGGFSVVKEVSTMENGKPVYRAVKIVRKVINGQSEQENDRVQAELEREVKIWRFLHHPHVLPLIAVYDSSFATFCIMPLYNGGTLFDLVRRMRKNPEVLPASPKSKGLSTTQSQKQGLPMQLVKRYLSQIASAVRYLHEDLRVVHRDLKLENCILDKAPRGALSDCGRVLLCDFGMSDFIMSEDRPSDNDDQSSRPGSNQSNIGPAPTSSMYSFGGSLPYASPEAVSSTRLLFEPYVDIWALGVMAFVMMTGDMPFHHPFEPKLIMSILKGVWNEELVRSRTGSADDTEKSVEFLRGCLEKDPKKRWTIADVLDSQLLAGYDESSEMSEGVAWA